ncbi:MAG: hypothetical protein ACNA8K_06585 [Cyclonatronaceae bacterium]
MIFLLQAFKKAALMLLVALMLSLVSSLQAQQVFERKAVEVSNLGISFTNVGTIGRPNVRNQPVGLPSMEYPRGSGTEHLFEAGFWLGAVVGGEIRVSTSAVTNPAGYSTGTAGFEFTNDGTPFLERSSLEDSENFSPVAVSHQDLIAEFSDRRVAIGTQPIAGHENPLIADVRMESYNWNFGFAEALTIVNYEITNDSQQPWDSVYFGIYSDMVVRNINTTLESGSAFFNKGGLGWIDSLYALYIFDRGSFDNPRINTYASSVIIGSEYRDVEFHPRRAEEVQAAGMRPPAVRPSFWLFGAGSGDFQRPNDDLERYNRMASAWPLEPNRTRLRTDGLVSEGNFIQLNSIGPYSRIEPGESINVYIAFVTALMPPDFQGIQPGNVSAANTDSYDNEQSRSILNENIGWAYRLFDGQELDDGSRVRFLVPEPPAVPRTRVELDAGKVSLYWDNRAESSVDPVTGIEDFAGYKIYRTKLGDDIRGVIGTNAEVIREFDVEGDGRGFNTGFEEVRLPSPVTFPDDPVEYHYRFDVEGMLSGWQYLFAVTSFDQGDERTPPLETSVNANAIRVFPGTGPNENFNSSAEEFQVGVYPNPYRINAAWDGTTPFTRKIMFYNLPHRAEIRIYTLSGAIVANLQHDSGTYRGDTRWFRDFSSDNRVLSGGEHAWDLLTEANQNLTTGLYLYTVKDLENGGVQRGKFAIIK